MLLKLNLCCTKSPWNITGSELIGSYIYKSSQQCESAAFILILLHYCYFITLTSIHLQLTSQFQCGRYIVSGSRENIGYRKSRRNRHVETTTVISNVLFSLLEYLRISFSTFCRWNIHVCMIFLQVGEKKKKYTNEEMIFLHGSCCMQTLLQYKSRCTWMNQGITKPDTSSLSFLMFLHKDMVKH